jgi:menaquinol-cytochrome c reductase iron-sulfur subunit
MCAAAEHEGERRGEGRRAFLKRATGLLLALCSAVLAIPVIGTFIGASFRSVKAPWLAFGRLDELPVGSPELLRSPTVVADAFVREHTVRTVWAVRGSEGSLRVYSPICPHLGCHYNWNPESGHFVCPCHGSVFALDGAVLGGPAPRPLDTLPTRVEGGVLLVEWERFRTGTPRKVPL